MKDSEKSGLSRRRFLAASSGLVAAVGTTLNAQTTPGVSLEKKNAGTPENPLESTESFCGKYQAGIVTPQQGHTYFAALDLITENRQDIIKMLRDWTTATARMTSGQPSEPMTLDLSEPGPDSCETMELPPARLTVTFGFGPGLFTKDGKDRYGLASRRPAALVDLPRFNGDQLIDARTGGDLSIQACADDPQVAFHAVRQLVRLAYNVAEVRWVQTGFMAAARPNQSPRNLMGFRDGTQNPHSNDPKVMGDFVWVKGQGKDWMQDGSYMVVRRIRMALEHWDRMNVGFQEQTVGRCKYSGAPLGKKNETEAMDLNAADKDGNPIIPDNAHVRLAAAETNDGAQILRRSYSYNEGVSSLTERWPPWRQGMEYDAGLLFVCYQNDPQTGFIKLFDRMSKLDAMNQFVTHNGSGIFACPGGVAKGEYIGQRLFEAS